MFDRFDLLTCYAVPMDTYSPLTVMILIGDKYAIFTTQTIYINCTNVVLDVVIVVVVADGIAYLDGQILLHWLLL